MFFASDTDHEGVFGRLLGGVEDNHGPRAGGDDRTTAKPIHAPLYSLSSWLRTAQYSASFLRQSGWTCSAISGGKPSARRLHRSPRMLARLGMLYFKAIRPLSRVVNRLLETCGQRFGGVGRLAPSASRPTPALPSPAAAGKLGPLAEQLEAFADAHLDEVRQLLVTARGNFGSRNQPAVVHMKADQAAGIADRCTARPPSRSRPRWPRARSGPRSAAGPRRPVRA